MAPSTQPVLFNVLGWQAMLDRDRDVFQELRPGSRIGLIAKESASIVGARYSAAADARFDDGVLVWEASDDGMRASVAPCGALRDSAIDLLLVVDEDAREAIRVNMEREPLATIKRLIRRGNILFYVTRTKTQLREAGYEDFLDSLGLAFLGACR